MSTPTLEPLPLGAVPLHDPVAPEVTAWARQVLVTTPWGHVVGPKVFPDAGGAPVVLVARVETHHNPTAQKPYPHDHPGVTVYAVPAGAVVAPPPAALVRVHGVDVSSYQRPVGAGHEIRWPEVAGAGYSFASVKCTEGLTSQNAFYLEELSGAKNIGLLCGAYHFFRIGTDPVEQARRFFREATAPELGLDLPLCLDVEDQSQTAPLGGVLPQDFAARVSACLAELGQLAGRKPLLYISPGFAARLGPAAALFADVAELWVAQWMGHEDAHEPTLPSGFTSWKLWQYSATAQVPGIGGGMDVDVFCGSAAELAAWATGATTAPDSTGDVEAGGRILEIADLIDHGEEGPPGVAEPDTDPNPDGEPPAA